VSVCIIERERERMQKLTHFFISTIEKSKNAQPMVIKIWLTYLRKYANYIRLFFAHFSFQTLKFRLLLPTRSMFSFKTHFASVWDMWGQDYKSVWTWKLSFIVQGVNQKWRHEFGHSFLSYHLCFKVTVYTLAIEGDKSLWSTPTTVQDLWTLIYLSSTNLNDHTWL